MKACYTGRPPRIWLLSAFIANSVGFDDIRSVYRTYSLHTTRNTSLQYHITSSSILKAGRLHFCPRHEAYVLEKDCFKGHENILIVSRLQISQFHIDTVPISKYKCPQI